MTEPTAERTFRLDAPAGGTLHGLVDYPDPPGERPTVVVCHGFKGFMEWGFFPHLAELLARRGFTVVRFNLSGSGMEPGEDRVTLPEAFRDNTYSRELADIEAVLHAVGETVAPGRVDRDRLGLLGHSRGGGGALLAAAREPFSEHLRALVTWAAIAETERWGPGELATWRERGETTVVNSRTGQELALGLAIVEDLEANADRLDLLAAARRRTVPWLIVHGTDDESVPADEAESLARVAAPPVELLKIEEAGHTFGAQHPWKGPTPHLTQAMNATQAWFRQHMT